MASTYIAEKLKQPQIRRETRHTFKLAFRWYFREQTMQLSHPRPHQKLIYSWKLREKPITAFLNEIKKFRVTFTHQCAFPGLLFAEILGTDFARVLYLIF